MSLRVRLSSYWCAFQEYLFPHHRGRPRSPGRTLPVVHRRTRVGAGGTTSALFSYPARSPATGSYGVGRAPSSPRRCSRSTLPGHCLNGWPTTGRCAACAAGIVYGRSPARRPSRVPFAGFAEGALPSRLHEALIENTMQEQLVGHVSRDATAIEGREQPTAKPKQPAKPKRKRGRPRKGEERPKEPSRLQRQQQMTLAEMLDDLPHACDVGTKRKRQGV